MDAVGFGGVVELDGAEEIAVIGHADGGHLLFGADLHELVDFAGAVEQGIVGVVVEVDEWGFGHRRTVHAGFEGASVERGSDFSLAEGGGWGRRAAIVGALRLAPS